MLRNVPWNLKSVLFVHVFRIAGGLLFVKLLYPFFTAAGSTAIEIFDRLLVIALVLLVVRRYRGRLDELGISREHLGRNVIMGILAGVGLLAVSVYSERMYATVLLLTPSQHPLVAMVKEAGSLRSLVIPLFLAGLAAPVAEEFLYRMFTFSALKDRWGLWGGAVGSAALFALMHFNAYWLAEIMIVGIGLALLYYWTGSLISSIVAHSLINTSKILMLFFGISLV